jgi:hypothetical protein
MAQSSQDHAIQSGGNVGVGTKTPGAKLDTVGTSIALRGSSSGATGTRVFGNATNATGVNFGVQTIWEARIERRQTAERKEGPNSMLLRMK